MARYSRECISSPPRCRHLFWAVSASVLNGAGGGRHWRAERGVGAVGFLIDSRVPVNHLLGFSGGKERLTPVRIRQSSPMLTGVIVSDRMPVRLVVWRG